MMTNIIRFHVILDQNQSSLDVLSGTVSADCLRAQLCRALALVAWNAADVQLTVTDLFLWAAKTYATHTLTTTVLVHFIYIFLLNSNETNTLGPCYAPFYSFVLKMKAGFFPLLNVY